MYRILFFLELLGVFSCKNGETIAYHKITGPTMGTKYHITAQCKDPALLKTQLDSILNDFNYSMSLYIDSSTLISFNKATDIFCIDTKSDPYFVPIFQKSKEIYAASHGALDPSIAPLVQYYGFGYGEKKKIGEMDTVKVSALRKLLVFGQLQLIDSTENMVCIRKPDPNVKLDFNAISPGYAVDVLYKYFESQDVKNFMINLGGEIRTKGVNDRGGEWVIGINKPSENADENSVELPLKVSNKAIATSGNYRNIYESKGQKFAHIIDPSTGLSRPSDILSATVIAEDCATADALATAFMVLGVDKALKLANELNNVDATFLFDKEGDGIFEFMTSSNMPKYYLHNEQ